MYVVLGEFGKKHVRTILTYNDALEATDLKAVLDAVGASISLEICVICAPRKPFVTFVFAMRVICDCLRKCA